MTERMLRCATRASKLARTQARWFADRLTERTGRQVELVNVISEGDRWSGSLTTIGGTGVFATAVREAVRIGDCDFAVHSAKDLPVAPYPGLTLAAVPPREDPRDALVARDGLTLRELPDGATVGTGSPRRAAQLDALELGLTIVDIRGNVETRLAMVDDGKLDAVVLANAGLTRLGLTHRITELLDPLVMLPAAGQGFLAIECRDDDTAMATLLATAHDDSAGVCLAAERAVLATLELGCSAPIGAMAECRQGATGEELVVYAALADLDRREVLKRSMVGCPTMAEQVGCSAAHLFTEDSTAAFAPTAHDEPAGDR